MALLRGTLVSADTGAWRAVVRLDGAQPNTMTNVRMTRLVAAEYAAGRRVIVDTGDHGDLADAVIIAVWT